MIKLANASTSNTQEANQVKLQDYYEKGWTHIIRPFQKYVNGLAFYAEKLCDNNNVLYSQEQRLTLNNFLKRNEYDINQINTKLYCDCSSFVGTCLNGVGINIDVASFTTRTMIDTCKRLGFEIIKFDKSKIMKGDILLKEGSHTVLVIKADEPMKIESDGRVDLHDIHSYLNVREKPSTNSKVITTLQFGDKVRILGQVNEWYNVIANGKNGYCYSEYIRT